MRLRSDFPFFAEHCLSIRTKSGSIEPFILNRAQTYIHERLEEQKARTGRVRALILKGGQQGCSTYVAARFYHQTTMNKGLRTFILTHEDAATQNLFEMVARFHKHSPDGVRPSTGAANAKELYFDRLDSGYKVGTAGTKAVGRSSTLQRFHGSEAAFWPHAESHAPVSCRRSVKHPAARASWRALPMASATSFIRSGETPSAASASSSPFSCRGTGRTNIESPFRRVLPAVPRRRNTSACISSMTSRWR